MAPDCGFRVPYAGVSKTRRLLSSGVGFRRLLSSGVGFKRLLSSVGPCHNCKQSKGRENATKGIEHAARACNKIFRQPVPPKQDKVTCSARR